MQISNNRGFTLIELMVTVAIIGILAAIAYPLYLDQVRKSRRAEAQSLVLQTANRQENHYTTNYEYADSMSELGLPTLTENEWYSVSTSQRDGDDQQFIVTATARNDQTKDDCYQYSINERSQKKAEDGGGSDTTDTCW